MARLSRTVRAIYRRTELRKSGPLYDSNNYHIAYQDLSPEAMIAVSNMCIAKGHRLISAFFGLGLMISSILDFSLGLGVNEEFTFWKAFGFTTFSVLILASFSRNFVIAQQMRIIDSIIGTGGGLAALSSDDAVKTSIKEFKADDYDVEIGSPVLGISGIDLILKD